MSVGHILIVDDQPHAVRAIELALTRRGYTVDTARDGKEALGKLQRTQFDVVITDLDMPRMPGKALCESIVARTEKPRPLVLIVTGMIEDDVRTWASRLADIELLEKPLRLKRLVERLEQHFGAGRVCDGRAAG